MKVLDFTKLIQDNSEESIKGMGACGKGCKGWDSIGFCDGGCPPPEEK